jgi:hypothetical protein
MRWSLETGAEPTRLILIQFPVARMAQSPGSCKGAACAAEQATRPRAQRPGMMKDEAPGKNALLFNSAACYLKAPWQEVTRPSKVSPT